MKRLGGWDAVLLYNETDNLHQHTLKIAVVDASDCDGFGFDRFRQTLARRLHLLEPRRPIEGHTSSPSKSRLCRERGSSATRPWPAP